MFWIEGYAGEDALNDANSPTVVSQGSASSLSDYVSGKVGKILKGTGVYRKSILKIRPNILIGLQKLRLRPKDRSRLFIYLIFLRQFS